MMQRSNKEKYVYKGVGKLSKVVSQVVVMRRGQEGRAFTEKPIKNKGYSTTGGISHHNSTKSSSGG